MMLSTVSGRSAGPGGGERPDERARARIARNDCRIADDRGWRRHGVRSGWCCRRAPAEVAGATDRESHAIRRNGGARARAAALLYNRALANRPGGSSVYLSVAGQVARAVAWCARRQLGPRSGSGSTPGARRTAGRRSRVLHREWRRVRRPRRRPRLASPPRARRHFGSVGPGDLCMNTRPLVALRAVLAVLLIGALPVSGFGQAAPAAAQPPAAPQPAPPQPAQPHASQPAAGAAAAGRRPVPTRAPPDSAAAARAAAADAAPRREPPAVAGARRSAEQRGARSGAQAVGRRGRAARARAEPRRAGRAHQPAAAGPAASSRSRASGSRTSPAS